jgi:hypothetical protein
VFASLLIIIPVILLHGCRRVALVGDSLLGCARDTIVQAINGNNGNSWVYSEHIWNACTSYTNPIKQEIYSLGVERAFGFPDVVVMSFAANDMMMVARDVITMESSVEAMQTLVNQAVTAGAMCIVLLESSHRLHGDHEHGLRFKVHMDDWFDYWHRKVGDNEYLGIPYLLLIADISDQVEADPNAYLADIVHLNDAGGQLAAEAIVEQINQCPRGRWIFGANQLDPEAIYAPDPRRGYKKNK